MQSAERGGSASNRRSSTASSKQKLRETALIVTRGARKPRRQDGSKKYDRESRKKDGPVSLQLYTLHFEKNLTSAPMKSLDSA
jgi:hypothetical protein